MRPIELINQDIAKLCDEQPPDFVIGEVIGGLYRIMERRGYRDDEIVEYMQERTLERCVGGRVLRWKAPTRYGA